MRIRKIGRRLEIPELADRPLRAPYAGFHPGSGSKGRRAVHRRLADELIGLSAPLANDPPVEPPWH